MSNLGILKKKIFKVSEITHIDEHIVTNGLKVLTMDVLLNNAYFIDIEHHRDINYPETNLYKETLDEFVNKGVTPVTWGELNIHPHQFIQFIQQTPRYSSLDISHCLFFFLMFENKKMSLHTDHLFNISADRTWPIARKKLFNVVLETPKGDFAHLPNSTLWIKHDDSHIYNSEGERMYFFDQHMQTLLPLKFMSPGKLLPQSSLDEFENYKSTVIKPILSRRFPYFNVKEFMSRAPVITTEIKEPCIVFKTHHYVNKVYAHAHMMIHLVHILVALEMFYREHESEGARLYPIYFVCGDLFYHKLLEILPASYFKCKINTEYSTNPNDLNRIHQLKFSKPYYFLFNILHDKVHSRFLMDIVDDNSYDYSTVLKETLGLFVSPRLSFLPQSPHLKIFFMKKKSHHSSRRYRGIPILTEEIENYVKDKGFIILSPDDSLTQRQLIEIYHQADVIIGFYGSFMANLHFMRPETYFITICQNYLSKQFMLYNYHLVHLLYEKIHHDRVFKVWMGDNVTIPFEQLKKCIEQVPLL